MFDIASELPLLPHPVIEVGLANDTGASATDRLTSDHSICGRVGDDGEIVSLKLAVDSPRSRNMIDITSLIQADGTFEVDRSLIRVLTQGAHVFHLIATDDDGNVGRAQVAFRLDTLTPGLSAVGLAAASDSGHQGDGRTNDAVVTLTGRAEAGAVIALGDASAIADRQGRFTLDDVRLALGTHTYEITATDAAGNTTTRALQLTRLDDPTVLWNRIALDVIGATSTAPMYATRLLAMESAAVYDVLAAIGSDPLFVAEINGPVQNKIDADAAIAQAAYDVLSSVYGADAGPYKGSGALRAMLLGKLTESLAEIPDGAAENAGVDLGHRVAASILAERAHDGWNAVVDPATEIGTAPGQWRPTPSGFANPLAPQWGDVTPWGIEHSAQFLPPPPPALDSAEYAAAYDETKAVGGVASTVRTADQTEIALFWADDGGTDTPPGHWNRIAGEIAATEGLTTEEIAHLFLKLNVALADAAITCWESKFTYDLWRPVTAIRLGETDGNALTASDAAWAPLIATPPFPEYTSGHSTFSGAAATILTAAFGDDYAFTTGTTSKDPDLIGVTRSFDSFWDAAAEAGQSRIYGGIHFQFANIEGLNCGQQIGQWVLDLFASQPLARA